MSDRVYCECCDVEIEGDVDQCPRCESRRIRKPTRCRCELCETKPQKRLESFNDQELELLRAAVEYHLCRADQREVKADLADEIALEIQRRRMAGNGPN